MESTVFTPFAATEIRGSILVNWVTAVLFKYQQYSLFSHRMIPIRLSRTVLFYFHKCSFVTNTFSSFLIFPMASLHSTNVKNKQSKNYLLLFPTHPQRVKLPFMDACCCHVFHKVCHSSSCF